MSDHTPTRAALLRLIPVDVAFFLLVPPLFGFTLGLEDPFGVTVLGYVLSILRTLAWLVRLRGDMTLAERYYATAPRKRTDALVRDAALAIRLEVLVQRRVDDLFVGLPGADHQRQVGLAGLALAKLRLQMGQRAAFLGDQQNTRGFAVQPVHQFQKACLGPRLAQLLDHAKAHAAAAMHGHAGRFVDGQHRVVVEQDGKFACWRRMRSLFLDTV